MRYNPLGRTGLMVSEICLGTMTFGSSGFFEYLGKLDQPGADAMVKAAFDAGVNFIDTANVYSLGASEEITGQAIRNLGLPRDELVVATKVMAPMGPGVNQLGASRAHILDQCKASLKRLRLDHIDLYQVHGWDAATPVEETVRALDDLVRQGHVRYVGVSNWYAWQMMKALGISERRGWERFQSAQCYYSLVGRELEREILPFLRAEGLGLMVWSPLAGGYLSGKYRSGPGGGRRDVRANPPVDEARGNAVVDVLETIARAHDATVAQAALAWTLHQPGVTTAIVGAKRLDQLEDNLGATRLALTTDQLAALDAASTLPSEYPSWMMRSREDYRAMIMGAKRDAS